MSRTTAVSVTFYAFLAVAAMTLQTTHAGPSPAADESARSETLSLAGVDLHDEQDALAFYVRLRDAAAAVCGPASLRITGSVKRTLAARRCATHALDTAVRKISRTSDSNYLQQVHRQQRHSNTFGA